MKIISFQNLSMDNSLSEKRFTKKEVMERFTDEELVTIYTLAKTTPQIEVWLKKFELAEYISNKDPATILGFAALESFGIIARGRAQQILDLDYDPTDEEEQIENNLK